MRDNNVFYVMRYKNDNNNAKKRFLIMRFG